MTARPGASLIWLVALLQSGSASALRHQQDSGLWQRELEGSAGDAARLARSLSSAEACLRLTTPGLELRYPEDAEQHMEEIREALWSFQPDPVYGKRKGGLFHAEHLWMSLYEVWLQRKREGAALSDVFGAYVPIFTHWVYPWFERHGRNTTMEDRMHYPPEFLAIIRRLLRRDVPYITLSQNDEGVPGKARDGFPMRPNMLVLSSGGYGHVPTPLWKHIPASFRQMYQVPPGPRPSRTYFMSYVGAMIHAPRDMRAKMRETIEQYAATHDLTVGEAPEEELRTLTEVAVRAAKQIETTGKRAEAAEIERAMQQSAAVSNRIVFYYNTTKSARAYWQELMFSSRFSLTPRGYGRTSYHLAEILLGGGIPVHVYSDLPWVPYRKVYETIGFHTDVAGLPALMDRLRSMPEDEFQAREARAKEHAQTHYLEEGMVDQIRRFIFGDGDLLCQRLPDNATDGSPP